MKLNIPNAPVFTHEGGRASHVSPIAELKRSTMACLLWEDSFYESGASIADRIVGLIPKCKPEEVAALAIECREDMKLRHIPLLLVRELARLKLKGSLVSETLSRVIQRPDELSEFLAIYWKDKKQPLSAQVKKGLASAFTKFNEYSLAKYNRDGAIKLRDVLFLCHAKPKDKEQEDLWKRLIDGKLETPDTWEVELSSGKDKKEVWQRLISENKLGALAFLRNLRNMQQANVDENLIIQGIKTLKTDRVLPYRFIAAARYAPNLEPYLEECMFKCVQETEKLKGKTVLLVDVSGSMSTAISGKSDMSRIDAACGLAILAREVCEQVVVVTFSDNIIAVPPRRGFALRDAINGSQQHNGTYLGKALMGIQGTWDRIITITDEQSADDVPAPQGKGYMINVAAYQNGVGYGPWTHISGWAESIIRYIQELERSNNEES